jgi:dipeptidyl aminopeptidase/acylaminoacyl peptidase
VIAAFVPSTIRYEGSIMAASEFAESIVGDWGGKPFVDMVQGFKYVLESYPQVSPHLFSLHVQLLTSPALPRLTQIGL